MASFRREISRACCGLLLAAVACDGVPPPQQNPDSGTLPPYSPAAGQLCSGDWCWESPYVQGSDLWAAWSFAADDVWAVGADATVMHWDGSAWSYRGPLEPGETGDAITGLWASGPEDLWMWGQAGVFHWNGSEWGARTPVPEGAVYSVFGTSASSVWAVGAAGLVARWNGSSWTSSSLGTVPLSDVWSDGNQAWAVGRIAGDNLEDTDSQLWHYDGATWSSEIRQPSVSALWGASATDVYAYGGDQVLHWNGDTWNELTLPVVPSVMWGSSAADLWAFDRRSEKVVHYDGRDWREFALPTGWIARAVAGTGPADLWMVGRLGRVAHWDGESWEPKAGAGAGPGQQEAAPALPGATLWGTRGDDLSAAGLAGGLVRWDGQVWRTEESFGSFASIWGTGAGTRWAVGSYARLAYSRDQTWEVTAGTAPRHFYGIWAASDTDAWAVGDGIYHHDGSAWTLAQDLAGSSIALRAIWGHSSREVWAVGDQGVILGWNGVSWESSESGVDAGLHAVWGFSADDVWVAGSRYQSPNIFHLVLLHWNGEAWREVDNSVLGNPTHLWGTSSDDLWLSVRRTGARGGTVNALLHWDGAQWTEERIPSLHHHGLWGWAVDQLAVTSNGGLLRYRGQP